MKRNSYLSLVFLFASAASLGVACGDGEPNKAPSVATGGTTSGDGDSDCAESETLCGDECVDTETSTDHCGACDSACDTGESCSAGVCGSDGCPGSETLCDNTCIDTDTDGTNCGACGNECDSDEACSDGECVADCPDGEFECGGTCVNPQNDNSYCGASSCDEGGMGGAGSNEFFCGDLEVCTMGSCESTCSDGEINCGGTCIDPLTDEDFCGATDCSAAETSGAECGFGQECQAGWCENLTPQWNDPVVLNTFSSAAPVHIEVADNGNALAIWRQAPDAGGGGNRLFSSLYTEATRSWSEPVRVDDGDEVVNTPNLAMNGSGDAIAVWTSRGTRVAVRMSRYDADTGTWSASEQVDEGALDSLDVTVAMDVNGNAHVAWLQNVNDAIVGEVPRVFTAYFNSVSEELSDPHEFSGYAGEHECKPSQPPEIAMSPNGAAIIWRDYRLRTNFDGCVAVNPCDCDTVNDWDLHGAIYDPGSGTWTRTELDPGTFPRPDSYVSMDESGNAYVTWASWNNIADPPEVTEPAGENNSDLFVSKFSAGGSWSAPAIIHRAAAGTDVRYTHIATNRLGESAVAISLRDLGDAADDDHDVRVIRLNSSLVVSDDVELATGLEGDTPPRPKVGIAEDGTIHALWSTKRIVGEETFLLAESAMFDPVAGTFGAPVTVNQGSAVALPRVAVSSSGTFGYWNQTVDGVYSALVAQYR